MEQGVRRKMSDKKNRELIPLSVTLMAIVAAVVLALSAVNALTSGLIAEREAEKGRVARQALIPDADGFDPVDFAIPETEAKTITAVNSAKSGEKIRGYCFDVTATGFGSDGISMIVAISREGNLYGVRVISNSETPGIGAAALEEDGGLLGQYVGVSVLSVDNVAAVSGATITSKGVAAGVKSAVNLLDQMMREGAAE